MTVQVPVFKDTVTEIPADWANTVSQLVYGVFGASGTAAGARLAMGLGTLALQNANEVQIAGGSIDNTPIGFTTPANAKFNAAYMLNAPVDPLHAVNKKYVDDLVASAADNIVSLEEKFVAKIGSTMTGPLVLSGDPVLDNAAATKHYVDQQITIRLASSVNSYQALRQYNGSATAVELTAPLISGLFILDTADTTSNDNNGTIIVDTRGRRWKREFVDTVSIEWFGADPTGSADSSEAFAATAVLQYPIAFREGATYLFDNTVTINGGSLVLRNRATIKLAGGVINNTDGSPNNFTPILRLQGMSYVDLGTTEFDQNNLNQVYPATASTFGRGTKPFLHNGSVEITPDSTNSIPSQNVHADKATFRNSYLNGLVLWQVVNAWVDESQFLNTGLNGVSAVGVRNVRLHKNQGYRCGVVSTFPASQYTGHRALINMQEFPTGITFLSEGIPCIVTGDYANGGVNKYVSISDNYGEQCSTNTVFCRATLGLTGGANRSYNVGYGRPLSAPSRAAHFHFEFCEGVNTNNIGYQDTVASGDGQPDGMHAVAMTGNASAAFPLSGNYRLDVRGARFHSAKDSSGAAIAGLLYTGLQASSNIIADQIDIDGTTSDGIDLTNYSTYESGSGISPHDASFNNAKLVNVGGRPILIKLTGSPTGAVTNIKAEKCTVDSGKEPITFDASVNVAATPPVSISYSTGPADWNVTAESVQASFNSPFLRTATNANAGTAALTGYQSIGDAGQVLSLGITSSGYTGTAAAAKGAFITSNAQATGGLTVAALSGALTLNAQAGATLSANGGPLALYSSASVGVVAATTFALTVNSLRTLTSYSSGNVGIGTSTTDDGNLLQVGGTLGIGQFLTANLPANPNGSPIAFAIDAAKQGETFPGSGAPVYFSNGKWRSFSTDSQVNTRPAQPSLIVGGTWDASTNHVNNDVNTSLADGGLQTINTGTSSNPVYTTGSANGYVYRNTVRSTTTTIDGYTNFDVDDLIMCIGDKWVKVIVNFSNVVFQAGTFS